MFENVTGMSKIVVSVLFFPYFFQNALLEFAWGAGDVPWLQMAKRLFLLLPVGVLILGLWVSIPSLITVIFRKKRREFFTAFLITWWDMGKAVFFFWGGIFRFVYILAGSVYVLVKVVVVGVWLVVQDILSAPVRLVRLVGRSVATPGLPWIALILTSFWCVLEATIFTYIMTGLVMDTLSNLTGQELSEAWVRPPLFLFMLFLILGSYAVLATWADAVRTKNIPAMVRISVIELVVIFVEVLFFYRELVDSLVPWFAQHAPQEFDLGAWGTLGIASLAWLGVRGMSWFLFAAHGTPIMMAIIQGSGLRAPEAEKVVRQRSVGYTIQFFQHIKDDAEWVRAKGEELLGGFVVPPLQVVAAGVNFLTLLVNNRHLFQVPFQSLREIMDVRLSQSESSRRAKREREGAAT